ncbi:hypothetical protein GCM10007939_21420 [Amylibacter marinus]|uniref:Tetratricopeptide repeat-containing protein n=2 Tax=Amylibacter marinus TaxID=1475483 RepID=A0ABQ5VWN9_9RHOB|nr:hypothetical protein GCM10007939_21420 [Amylibacter marinus]
MIAPAQMQAQGLAGAYLSGSSASYRSDYKAARHYFTLALQKDPDNSSLVQNAMLAALGMGELDAASELARRLDDPNHVNQLRSLILLADALRMEDFERAAVVLADAKEGLTPILSDLIAGWIELGRGKMGAAIAAFDAMDTPETLRLFGQYHKSLALAAVGDFEEADRLLTGDERGSLRLSRGSLLAHTQIMAELGRKDEALELLDSVLRGGQDIEIEALRAAIANDSSHYNYITTARQGAAEVFRMLAGVLAGPDNQQSNLLYVRIAQALRPDNGETTLLVADILRALEQNELAIETYATVPIDSAHYLDAEFGRADTLVQLGKGDAAVEVLRSLTRSHGDNPRVHMTLGDILRVAGKYSASRAAYDQAVKMIKEPARNHWFLFYALGVCNERLDNWPRAEMNFNRALELEPNQPDVLNYLGYSLVEKGLDLERAQQLIEDALKARPNSGVITDSLGWVRYRLGKFEAAVEPMEMAVELLPDDPVVNDHLGDVYWKVGHKRRAEFQWRRALSFEPEAKDESRILLKLELGLDEVLDREAKKEVQTGAQ